MFIDKKANVNRLVQCYFLWDIFQYSNCILLTTNEEKFRDCFIKFLFWMLHNIKIEFCVKYLQKYEKFKAMLILSDFFQNSNSNYMKSEADILMGNLSN